MTRRTLLLSALAGIALCPTAAHAWKPTMHVYLAQQAAADAADGKVSIDIIDPTTRAPVHLGDYEVDPAVVAALRSYPVAFVAGAIGPDSYPDMITGQMRIHPPGHGGPDDADVNVDGPGTEPWLRQLWLRAHEPGAPREALAFVHGFLAHAAGDYFGHTYINAQTGGIFSIGPNGLAHFMLEGYIGQRTPDLAPIDGKDPYDAFLGGMTPALASFIARNTALLPDRSPVEQNRLLSLPWWFASATYGPRQLLAAYDRAELALLAPLGEYADDFVQAHRVLDWACDVADLASCPVSGQPCPAPYDAMHANPGVCGSVSLGLQVLEHSAAPAFLAWRTFVDTAGPPAAAIRRWVANIDEGLADWVETNHRFAYHMMFNRRGMDAAAALREWSAFEPVAAGMLAGFDTGAIRQLQRALDLPEEALAPIEQFRSDAHARHITMMFGMSPEELQTKYASAHTTIDPLFGSGKRAQFDRDMGLDAGADDDFAHYPADPITRYDWRAFAPAYDTVILIKLSLMSGRGLQSFYGDLAARAHVTAPAFVEDNVMLGWGQAIDGSNQWSHGMPMTASGCAMWRLVFKPVTARGKGPTHPGEPDDVCAPAATATAPAPLLLLVTPPGSTTTAGATITVRSMEAVALRSSVGTIAATCTPTAPALPCTATYRVPALTEDTDVVLEATDPRDARRRTAITLRALAPLAVRMAPVTTPAGDLDALAVGGSVPAGARVVLEARPRMPVRWTLVGPGRLAPVDAAPSGARPEVAPAVALGPARAYVAPDRAVAGPVRVRVESLDGRSAELVLTVRPALPSLVAAPVSVTAGGTVEIGVQPAVPVRWTVAPGGVGTIGLSADERARLDAQVKTVTPQLRGLRTRAFDARSVEPLAALAKAQSTYRAPAAVARPTVVTLQGVTLDGTGRKLTATVTVKPSLATPPRPTPPLGPRPVK